MGSAILLEVGFSAGARFGSAFDVFQYLCLTLGSALVLKLSSTSLLKVGLQMYVEDWGQRLCLGMVSALLLEAGLSASA